MANHHPLECMTKINCTAFSDRRNAIIQATCYNIAKSCMPSARTEVTYLVSYVFLKSVKTTLFAGACSREHMLMFDVLLTIQTGVQRLVPYIQFREVLATSFRSAIYNCARRLKHYTYILYRCIGDPSANYVAFCELLL